MLIDGTEEAVEIARALEQGGYRLVCAATVIEAESLFVTTMAGAIVLGLEERGALGFCDLVRAIPRFGGIPLIVAGRSDDPYQAAKEALLHGADAYLRRPIDLEELLRQLRALLGDSFAPMDVGTPGATPVAEDVVVETSPDDRTGDTAPVPGKPDRSSGSGPDADGEGVAVLPAVPGGTREPTQVLEDHASPIERAVRDAGGFSWSDFVASEVFDEGQGLMGPESAPWELGQDLVRSDEEGHDTGDLDDEPLTSAKQDTDLPTVERRLGAEADGSFEPEGDPTEDIEIPWSLPTTLSSIRREAGQATAGDPQGAPFQPVDSLYGARPDSELSAEFRRVIDEVAQRLFPEASPDEYQDEHFDEIKTVVPQVSQPPSPYDFDGLEDYDFDAMATFASGHMGITLSRFDESETEEKVETPTSEADGESETGALPTQWRSPEGDLDDRDARPPVLEPGGAPRDAGFVGDRVITPQVAGPSLLIEGQVLTRGKLEDCPFPVLLAGCIVGRITGQLTLRLERETAPPMTEGVTRRTVFFEDGRPIAVTSALRQDRLVELLRRQGRLSLELFEECRARVASSGRRPGAVLVELGVIKTTEVLPLVQWHYEELLHRCFAWRRGTFRLEPRSATPRWHVVIAGSGPELLLEGLRRRAASDELERHLGGPRARLRRIDERAPDLPPGTLLEGEEELLALCDGHHTLTEILERSRVDRAQALAVLHGLQLLARLDPEGSSPEPLPDDLVVDRRRLEQRIRRAREADYFALLGVTSEASPYEIRRAFERARKELAPEQLARLGVTDLDGGLSDVRYVLEEAFEVLSDDVLRRAYRQNRFGLS